jgi:hypothetical protein
LLGPAARVASGKSGSTRDCLHDARRDRSKVGDLFEPEPATWGLRGDPHVWRALRQHLSGRNLPTSTQQLVDLLNAAFEELVGVDVRSDAAPSVYREQFAHGGMSSGMVSLDMWREQLMPTLMERASMLMNDGGPTSKTLS